MVQKKIGSAYADFTPVPPSTTLEVKMLCHKVRHKRKKNLARYHMMIRLWKVVKNIFTCVALEKEFAIAEPNDYVQFQELR